MTTLQHFIVARDVVDQPTIDKAIRLLAAQKFAARIPSKRAAIQADIDALLDMRATLD